MEYEVGAYSSNIHSDRNNSLGLLEKKTLHSTIAAFKPNQEAGGRAQDLRE
jgi:hypothetical protein